MRLTFMIVPATVGALFNQTKYSLHEKPELLRKLLKIENYFYNVLLVVNAVWRTVLMY